VPGRRCRAGCDHTAAKYLQISVLIFSLLGTGFFQTALAPASRNNNAFCSAVELQPMMMVDEGTE
jgi:hypothetical protein